LSLPDRLMTFSNSIARSSADSDSRNVASAILKKIPSQGWYVGPQTFSRIHQYENGIGTRPWKICRGGLNVLALVKVSNIGEQAQKQLPNAGRRQTNGKVLCLKGIRLWVLIGCAWADPLQYIPLRRTQSTLSP
jgi:hypothetical protein